jgi:CPA2 family monovalent cation:H+ antiporter-2
MHEGHAFLITLAMVLGVAALTTVVFQRLKQPVVFGYMLAGLIIGPHLPVPLVADEATVRTLSELGVILLMFSLGLEFHFRRLIRAGWTVVIIAVLETSFMIWLGHEAGRVLGWSVLASLYAGAALAISSTTIIVKALADRADRGRSTEMVFGILIVEDLIAILLLALLTPAGAQPSGAAGALGFTFFRLFAFLAAFLVVGLLVVPRFMRFVVHMRRPEITLVVSMGLCFGAAVLVQSIGYSVALGAFLAGALVAESGEAKVVERLAEPVRDMFLAVFFVSVGMMIVPELVLQHWAPIAGFTLLVVFGKIAAVSFASFLTGAGIRTSVQTAMSMAQIGEFSFIIAAAGVATGATPSSHYPIVVAVSAITTLTTPWLIRFADPAAAWIDRNLPRRFQTFAVLYGTWIEHARMHPESSADRQKLRRTLRAVAMDACVVAGVGIGLAIGAAPAGAWLAAATGLHALQARSLVVGVALLVSVPFFFGIVRTGRVLGDLLARRAFVEPMPGRLDPAAAPRRAMIVAVQLATVMAAGAPLIAVTQPFLPAFAGISVLLAGAIVMGVIFWRSAADLQGHVRAAAEAIVHAMDDQHRRGGPAESERSLQRAYELVPGLGEPVPVSIAADSPFAGRTLADTELRGRTGATVIAISRGPDVVLVPDGHELLQAGDVLALAGTREAVDAARKLLKDGV